MQKVTSPKGHKRTMRQSLFTVSKRSIWPELVGRSGLDARRYLKEHHPIITAQIVEIGDMITEDYAPERVQIFVDDNGIVTWPPQIG